MLVAVLLATLLVVATFSLHYKVLRTISTIVPQINLALEARVLCVILIAFLAHIVAVKSLSITITACCARS